MIDKTMLELVDRLVATTNRATKAEYEAEFYKNQLEDEHKAFTEATDLIKKLEAENQSLNDKLEEQKNSTSYWYNEARKFEKELKEYKGKTTSEEAKHLAEVMANRTITADVHEKMGFAGAEV